MGREAYKTSSGLIDDFDFWCEEAWWATDKRFGGGKNPLLHLRGQALIDNELVNEEETLLYGTGEGWKISAGGQEVAHPSGKDRFSNNSNVGKLIDALVELGDEPVDTMAERGVPSNAEIYLGVGLHMERKTFTFKDRETKEENSYEVVLPTSFLGWAEGETEAEAKPVAKKPAPTKKTTAPVKKAAAPVKKASPRPKAKAEVEEASDSDLRAAIVEYAGQYEDTDDGHVLFVEAVYDAEYFDRVDELNDDEELSAEVLDRDSALWTEAH